MTLKKDIQMNFAFGFMQMNLDPNHEFCILANRIDWDKITDELSSYYSKIGRKSKSIRMMVGLHIVKHLRNLSDERVVQELQENLYVRYLCGVGEDVTDIGKARVIDSTTMTKFRNRIGEEGMKAIERVINSQLLKEKRIDVKTQIVDTTAMEKNITYPTNGKLLMKGRTRLVRKLKKLQELGVDVSYRSYDRLAKKSFMQLMKLGKGRAQRTHDNTKKLIKYAKEVVKAATNAITINKKRCNEQDAKQISRIKESLSNDTRLINKIINQSELYLEKQPCKDKILSLHEPHVVVIAKGKRAKRYEFGCKVSLSMDKNGFILGHREYDHNIADVNTLGDVVNDWRKTFGDYPVKLAADRGYQTNNVCYEQTMIKKVSIPTRGKKRHADADKRYFRELQKQRNCIEPVIGHLKSDHRMNICRYSGSSGDKINVSLATLAWNCKKWVRDIQKEELKAA